jgi:glycosyltransferase involved in cell wall biosynthesis
MNILPVSVVIPCYRCKQTIERALHSVLYQTWLPAEILLVDDGSGDGTLELLYRLERNYAPKVRVIFLAINSGAGFARNAGWEASSQPWLAFLDADDAWHPRKLEIQWNWITSKPDVALCGHASKFLLGPIDIRVDETPKVVQLTSRQMLFSNRLPTRSVMLRKDLPFRFSKMRRSEDYLLWLEIIFAGFPAYRLDTCLAFCFRPEFSPGGLSGQLWEQERSEIVTLGTLRKKGLLTSAAFVCWVCFSFLKYLCRIFLIQVRP